MDHRRFNISQLAIETNTSRTLLSEWVKNGYLVPTQIVGNRMKFSIEAFERAEKLHNAKTLSNLKNQTPVAKDEQTKKSRKNKVMSLMNPKVGQVLTPEMWDLVFQN